MDAGVLASLIMVGVGQGGRSLNEVEWPLLLAAGSFAFLQITSITLLWVSLVQKEGNPTQDKESKGIWRNSVGTTFLEVP